MKSKQLKNILLTAGFLLILIPACTQRSKKEAVEGKQVQTIIYTCPMHPQIIRDKPGDCPICGMALVKKGGASAHIDTIGLATLLKPADRFVVSSIPTTAINTGTEPVQTEALGVTAYNTDFTGSMSARTSGRIERLYLKYNFQNVRSGQKVMELYSPELLTAQENLLFILQNDASNTSLIDAAKQKLLLLGFPSALLQQVIRYKKSMFTVPVLSNYSGHIHDMGEMPVEPQLPGQPLITPQLMLKEGMYVSKGQTLFKVYNPNHLWVLLNIYPQEQYLVQKGQQVTLTSKDYPDATFSGRVSYVEPFFREGAKTSTVRVTLTEHQGHHIPVGTQFRAIITGSTKPSNWLPRQAVLSLGIGKIVFIRQGNVFSVRRVETGYQTPAKIQILKGLGSSDSVAINAQFLIDSEGFIKVNQ